jgi:gluconate 2-dehydrogenase alpha chain
MAHICPFAFGLFPGRKLNRWNGSGGQIVVVEDWNADNFDHADVGFLSGASLMVMQEVKPIQAATDPLPPGVPRWGSGWKGWLKENAQSIGSGFAQIDNLSYEDNLLDLDPVARDAFGLPRVRCTHRVHDREREAWDFYAEKIQEWLRAAGATQTWPAPTFLVDPRHPAGGTRMGDDPETSVVDGFGLSHEVPNVGVLGASVFPTTGGVNPTLTVQAVAWRTADHLADDWGAHSAGERS